MNDFKNRIRPDWPKALRDVLDRATAMGKGAVLAFDLDSTLFDNRPRQARIVREFGQARNIASLAQCQTHHFESGWDLRAAMRKCGASPEEADQWYPGLKSFWVERFFTNAYCLDDEAIPGAARYLARLAATKAILCYVTGRHAGMRQGTVDSLKKCGMVSPGDGVHLIMKPSFDAKDDDFKRQAHAKLKTFGTLVAAFDNEPTHANDYHREFPSAQVIHLATDHSGRPVDLVDAVVSVPHFALDG